MLSRKARPLKICTSTILYAAQHKILTNCLSQVKFNEQLLEGHFE